MKRAVVSLLPWLVWGSLAALACRRTQPSGASGAASASASALSSVERLSGGTPLDPAMVASTLNPRKLPPYAGPTGTIQGVIHIKGDPPTSLQERVPPPTCAEAISVYGHSFRVSPDNALADALVAVTDYEAFVPARSEAAVVRIHGCAFSTRSLVVTFGQRVEISNTDKLEAYLPNLLGAQSPARMVAVPKGDAVKIYPPAPGHYVLQDDLTHPWMKADVFVLKYATHAVTDVEGHYRLENIPTGRVTVNVMHPAMEASTQRVLEVSSGAVVSADMELLYDRKTEKKDEKKAVTNGSRTDLH